MDVTIAQQTNGNLRIELVGAQRPIREALAAPGWEKSVKAAVEKWLGRGKGDGTAIREGAAEEARGQ